MIVVHYPNGDVKDFDGQYDELDQVIETANMEVTDAWVKNDVSHFVVDVKKELTHKPS